MEYLDCVNLSEGQIFTSVDEANEIIGNNFPQKAIDLPTPARNTFSKGPRYLFRGESGEWGSSVSSMQRIRNQIDPLTKDEDQERAEILFSEIKELTKLAGDYIQQAKGWDQLTAAGFLQHYEMPTEFLDFTASLRTALGFALWNVTGQNTGPTVAYFCVADAKVLSEKAVLPDFAALMQDAKRPRLQEGYGVYGKHQDLKSQRAIEDYQLRWFAIHVNFADLAKYALNPRLLDLASDGAAGFMKWVLDMAVEDCNYLSDKTAAYLAKRVAAVAPIKSIKGKGRANYSSHAAVGKVLNVTAQQAQNYIDWRRGSVPAGSV